MGLIEKIKKYGIKKSADLFVHKLVYGVGPLKTLRKSYSQYDEDIVIDKELGFKKNGFYVDIGAYDPQIFSNTRRFYEKGWNGINIEPNPLNCQKFVKIRVRDINLNMGVGLKDAVMDFYLSDPDTLSTFSKEKMEEFQKRGEYNYQVREIVKIRTKPLKEILNENAGGRQIDFMTIDTEGYEIEVLTSNDWAVFRPKIICIESVDDNGNEDQKILHFLNSSGYERFYYNNLNAIYRDRAESK